MSVGVAEPMARKSPDRKRKDVAAKVDAEIVRKARVIASMLDMSVAEVLSDTLEAPIEAWYQAVLKQEMDRARGKR